MPLKNPTRTRTRSTRTALPPGDYAALAACLRLRARELRDTSYLRTLDGYEMRRIKADVLTDLAEEMEKKSRKHKNNSRNRLQPLPRRRRRRALSEIPLKSSERKRFPHSYAIAADVDSPPITDHLSPIT